MENIKHDIGLSRALVSTVPQVLWHLWLLDAIQEKLEICSQNVLLLASFSELGTCGNEILTRALRYVNRQKTYSVKEALEEPFECINARVDALFIEVFLEPANM